MIVERARKLLILKNQKFIRNASFKIAYYLIKNHTERNKQYRTRQEAQESKKLAEVLPRHLAHFEPVQNYSKKKKKKKKKKKETNGNKKIVEIN